MLWRAGEKVGQYEIISELGRGGMATVYKAHHKQLDRHVAIKVMHQTYADDENFIERFSREARIVASLEHPHIVPVYDYNDYNGMPYLVMKFVQGRSLKELQIKKPLTLDQIMHVMTAVGKATTYAHKKGVLHRDIKPSNIIIDNDNIPYLADFGLARIVASGESTMSADVLLGTPNYMSPEQARGDKDIDYRSDLYSLGIVLYELVVGQVPFSATTPLAVIQDHINTPLPRPSLINPDVPPKIERVLRKALAKSPGDRYDSADEMIDDFIHAVQSENLESLTDNRKQVADDSLSRWRSAYIKENSEEDSLAEPIRNLAMPSIAETIDDDVSDYSSKPIEEPQKSRHTEKPKKQSTTSTIIHHEPNSRYWILAGAGIITISLFLIVAVILNTSNTFLEIAEIIQRIDEDVDTTPEDTSALLLELPDLPIGLAEANVASTPDDPVNYLILARSQYKANAINSARDTLKTGYIIAEEDTGYLANTVSIANKANDKPIAMAYAVLLWETTYKSTLERDKAVSSFITEYLYNQSLTKTDMQLSRDNLETLSEFLPTSTAQTILRSHITRIMIANNHIETGQNRLANLVFQTWTNETYALPIGELVRARHNILENELDSASNQLKQLVETSTTPTWIVTIAENLLINLED